MSKHTPGPWKVSLTDDTTVIAPDNSVIAEIDGDYNQPDLWPIMEANARLIAAAPELLEALKDCIKRLRKCALHNGNSEDAVNAMCEQFDTAIAKVEGR